MPALGGGGKAGWSGVDACAPTPVGGVLETGGGMNFGTGWTLSGFEGVPGGKS
jgi:hypothetical protein